MSTRSWEHRCDAAQRSQREIIDSNFSDRLRCVAILRCGAPNFLEGRQQPAAFQHSALKGDAMLRNLVRLSMLALLSALPASAAWADGAVYAMTNALDNNQVLVYHRAANGNLSLVQTAATGGGGSGLQLAGVDSLGSAGSVQLDPD